MRNVQTIFSRIPTFCAIHNIYKLLHPLSNNIRSLLLGVDSNLLML